MTAEFSPVELLYDLFQACPELDALYEAWSRYEAELPPAVEALHDQAVAQLKRDPDAWRKVADQRRIGALEAELEQTRAALAEAEAQLQAAAREPVSDQVHVTAEAQAAVGSGSLEHESPARVDEPTDHEAACAVDRSLSSAMQGEVVFGQARTYREAEPRQSANRVPRNVSRRALAEHDEVRSRRDPGDTPPERRLTGQAWFTPVGVLVSIDSRERAPPC